jgi:hypothetical protein
VEEEMDGLDEDEVGREGGETDGDGVLEEADGLDGAETEIRLGKKE